MEGDLMIVEEEESEDSDFRSMSEYDQDLARVTKKFGLNFGRGQYDSDSNTDSEIDARVNEALEKDSSRPRRSKNKQSAKDAETAVIRRAVSAIIEQANANDPKPAPALDLEMPNKVIDYVELSDDEEEAAVGIVKNKRRQLRLKNFDLINLEDLGLGEEKDNFIRAGDVDRSNSWFSPIDADDKDMEKFVDLRNFREIFRKIIKERVENDLEYPDVEAELDHLRVQQEALRIMLETYQQPTNPVESVLLNFRHPQKCHGLPFNTNEGIISNYKLVLEQDEIQFPNEFSDDLPSEEYYLLQKHCNNFRIINHLEKITPRRSLPPHIDVSQSAHFVKRLLAERLHCDGRISQEEKDIQMELHPQPKIIKETRNGWDRPLPQCSRKKLATIPVAPLIMEVATEQLADVQIYQEDLPMEENIYLASYADLGEEFHYKNELVFEESTEPMSENLTEAYIRAEEIAKASDLFDI